jgi:hypothetical protein
VNNRRTLAHSADDTMTIDTAEQTFEIRVTARIVEDDRVLDCDGNAIIN